MCPNRVFYFPQHQITMEVVICRPVKIAIGSPILHAQLPIGTEEIIFFSDGRLKDRYMRFEFGDPNSSEFYL